MYGRSFEAFGLELHPQGSGYRIWPTVDVTKLGEFSDQQ
jgi:hypothetical protein